jgi:hypothetical protein
MFLLRAFLVWLIIMAGESIHGTLRQLFLAPLVGDSRARQISLFTGMLLIFTINFLFIRWIHAETTKSLLAVGLVWMALTVLFEFALGILMLNYSWERMFEDYDISRGGLMAFGLLFMLIAPLLAAKLRGMKMETARSFSVYVQSRKSGENYRTVRTAPARRAV